MAIVKKEFPLLKNALDNGHTIESICAQWRLAPKHGLLEQKFYEFYVQEERLEEVSNMLLCSAKTGLVSIHEEFYQLTQKDGSKVVLERGTVVYVNGRCMASIDNYPSRIFGKSACRVLLDTIGGSELLDMQIPTAVFNSGNTTAAFLAEALFNIYSYNTSYSAIEEELRKILFANNFLTNVSAEQNMQERIAFAMRLLRAFVAYYEGKKDKLEYAKFVHNWLSSGAWNTSEDKTLRIPHPDNGFIKPLVKSIKKQEETELQREN